MTLNASGPISFGGSTTGQSINLELGVSATALASIDSTSFRTLAGVSSGAISLSNFYGKSNFTWPSAIGAAFQGGFYAGMINVSGTPYFLVVSDATVGQSQKAWGPTSTTTGFTSVINGPTNSAGLAALGSSYAAATFCETLNSGSYTDWYLPAQNELEVCYYFLKPTTASNTTSVGSNANAVTPEPVSTNYIATRPKQTTATNFRSGASSQEFKTNAYSWSSTETSSTNASVKDFAFGDPYSYDKTDASTWTRAVRRVAAPVMAGQAYGGGYFVGLISANGTGVATHYLIVSDITVGQTSAKWGPTATTTGITSPINGSTNSAALAALGATYAAATFCEGLNTGGYTDWYMPALNELEVCYFYLKPGTTSNNTSSGGSPNSPNGSNPNAVSPETPSTGYVATSPPQTSATNFRTGASSQEFAVSSPSPFYYTSTEADANNAQVIRFTSGEQNPNAAKDEPTPYYLTRAIRKVAL